MGDRRKRDQTSKDSTLSRSRQWIIDVQSPKESKQGRKDPGLIGRRSNTGKEEWDSKLGGEAGEMRRAVGVQNSQPRFIAGSSGREPPAGNNKQNKTIQLFSDHTFDCFKKEFNSLTRSVTLM